MRHIKELFLLFILCMSCTYTNDTFSLSEAEKMLEYNPDSVLVLLNQNKKNLKYKPQSYQVRFLLCLADAQNKTFSKILPSKKIETLIDYMHGTGDSYELARAYYLLGSAYRDEGEKPKALKCYHKSVSLLEQKNNKKALLFLSRIYGQIADIFDSQNLPNMTLASASKAQKYSLLAGDTAFCATSLSRSIVSYQLLNKYSLSIRQGWRAIALYKKVNDLKNAAVTNGLLALSYIRMGQCKMAKCCLDEYRNNAGVYDKNGNIEHGREIHYEILGEYYFGINQLDSAEYYFRKTLTNQEDGDCQEAGHRGLYLLYKKIGNKDSLAKYADLAYQINDKRTLELSSREIQNMQQLYNYTRNQEIAKQEQERSGRLTNWVIGLSGGLLVCILTIVLYYNKVKSKRKLERREYEKKMESLIEAKQKQKLLLDNQIERITEETNRQIEVLSEQLAAYQDEKNMSDRQRKEDELHASVICQKFHQVGGGLETLCQDDWNELELLLFAEYPSFQTKMMAYRQNMMPDDYQLCLLSRLRFAPYEIGNILNLKSSNVTMKRKRLLKILFDTEGNAKKFDGLLQTLS